MSRSRGPQFRRAREFFRSCAREIKGKNGERGLRRDLLLTSIRKRSFLNASRGGGDDLIRAEGANHLSDHRDSSYFGEMPGAVNTDRCAEGLRVRRCFDPTCNTLFPLCASCDRGQRYCRDPCRKRMRQRQLQSAGRRYQSSGAGKQNHCQRQQRYRQRHSLNRVTHQGPVSITTPQPPQPGSLSRCAVCGRENRWISPFYWIPRRKRRIRQRARVGDRSNSHVFA